MSDDNVDHAHTGKTGYAKRVNDYNNTSRRLVRREMAQIIQHKERPKPERNRTISNSHEPYKA